MSSPKGEINAAEPVSEVAGTSLGAMATGATSKGIANKVQAWSVSLNVCSIAHHGDPDLRSQQVQENPEKLGICARKKRGFKAHSHAPNALPRHLISLSQIYERGLSILSWLFPITPKIAFWKSVSVWRQRHKDPTTSTPHRHPRDNSQSALAWTSLPHTATPHPEVQPTQHKAVLPRVKQLVFLLRKILFPTLTVRTKIAKTVVSIPKIEIPIIILLRFWKSEHEESSPSIYTCD